MLSHITSPQMSEVLLRFSLASQPSTANQFKLSDWERLDKIITDVIGRGLAAKVVIQVLNDTAKEVSPVLVESVLARVKVQRGVTT